MYAGGDDLQGTSSPPDPTRYKRRKRPSRSVYNTVSFFGSRSVCAVSSTNYYNFLVAFHVLPDTNSVSDFNSQSDHTSLDFVGGL